MAARYLDRDHNDHDIITYMTCLPVEILKQAKLYVIT